MLQFITNTNSNRPIFDQVTETLAGGCKWIQLRMKEASDDEVRKVAKSLKPICKENDAFLILNDRVELAKELEVDGVHIGKNDMPPGKARVILGAEAIIGVTANTFEDIEYVKSFDIDYIGIGPYHFTTTKDNLAPVIGIEGYKEIISKMEAAGIDIATVAVGGITICDVESLMKAGVDGVAVSGAIANARSIKETTQDFIAKLKSLQ